ncbi:MAG: 2OG-Fe(II) oxygenase [Rhodospirillales bacterium]|nr:2OG-Fe(II) oxygenase [Rhodospirillales bacterium]
MIRLDHAALRATPVASEPFPHVVLRHFVPPEQLAPLLRDLPPMAQGGSFPISALRLGPRAKALAAEMEGPTLREAIARKFGLDLTAAPTMLTLRGQSRERDGSIHTDSTSKRVTVLLYLNQAKDAWAARAGCLRLLRSPNDIEDYAVEVPPIDGTLLVFPNGPTAWHGHKRHIGERYVMQLNYMARDAKARSELRRHRFSAFIKRLTTAA